MSDRQAGLSVVELLVMLIVISIMTAAVQMPIDSLLKQTRVSTAYNTTLSALRQARDNAVDQKGAYQVSFNVPAANAITVAPLTSAFAGCGGSAGAALWTGAVSSVYSLPNDIAFQIVSGVPTSPSATPDGFGIGAVPIDFDQVKGGGASTIIFCPDGTAEDAQGNYNNGVVYLARSQDLYSSRAITLWGITGRLRGWRLVQNGPCGSTCWSQQ